MRFVDSAPAPAIEIAESWPSEMATEAATVVAVMDPCSNALTEIDGAAVSVVVRIAAVIVDAMSLSARARPSEKEMLLVPCPTATEAATARAADERQAVAV